MTYSTRKGCPGVLVELVCPQTAEKSVISCGCTPVAVADALLAFSDEVGVPLSKINIRVIGELLAH